MKSLRSLLLLLVLVVTANAPTWADHERRGSDPGPHPIKLLKVIRDGNPSGQQFGETRGSIEIWLQNAADADVDKVTLEVELWNKDGRFIEKIVRNIGTINANSRSIQKVKWNLVGGENNVTQKIWVLYNAGKEHLTQFEAIPVTW